MASGAKLVETVGPIWREWKRYVCGVFNRVLGSPAATEDLTQQVFLAICTAVHRGDEIRDPRAYIIGTINNLLRQHFEEEGQTVTLSAAEDTGVWPVREPEPGAYADAELVEHLLSRLSWQERYIVVATHYLELPREEIGQALGLPRTTVNRRYATAMLKMRFMANWEAIEPLEGCEQ